MKIHLVVAHSEPRSFNLALHQTAVSYFADKGVETLESDLYRLKFESAASVDDTPEYESGELFQLGKAQQWAIENSGFTASINLEQQKLLDADVVILQFPLWWASYPAILKGWIDRVLSSGFAYGSEPLLKPRKVLYSITTGGAKNEEEHQYYQQKVEQLYDDVFGYMGWECLPAFFAHGVEYESFEKRQQILKDYTVHLKSVMSKLADLD